VQRSSLFVAVLVGGLAFASLASAQVGGSDLRIGAGMVLDFGGEAEIDNGPGRDVDDDTKLTPGIRFHLDYDVHRYISVGGLTRFQWWEGDDVFEDRNFLWDLAGRINGHYDWRDFRFYVAFNVGFSLSAIQNGDDDWGNYLDNPGKGFNIGLAPGFEYWFSGRFGMFLEMFGWSGHRFNHDHDGFSGDADMKLDQVVWQLGINFAP
jgi:hypothetical protein